MVLEDLPFRQFCHTTIFWCKLPLHKQTIASKIKLQGNANIFKPGWVVEDITPE